MECPSGPALCDGESLIKPRTCERHGHEKHQVNPTIPPWKPWNHDSTAEERAPVGSVLTYSDSDWAGGADRFSVSGAASWQRGKLGWYPIIASRRKQSTIALSSGEAEWVAALSGTCEGMGLRQQWNCLRQFGNTETETSQQILCCDSAALGMITHKGSTRERRHIKVKAFFLQQWSARPEVRLVQVGTSEMLADCLTMIQSTPNSIHLSKLGLDIKSSPELVQTWSKKNRAEEECRNSTFFDNFVRCFFFFCFRSLSELTRRIHAVLCSTSFLYSFERERCGGLKREWSSVDCVSAFASRHWFSVWSRSA